MKRCVLLLIYTLLLGFSIRAYSANKQPFKNHALFFTVEEYDHWMDLRHPLDEAQRIAQVLREDYAFETEIVKNPNRRDIFNKLQEYRKKQFDDNDQLLIFFSGHGTFSEETMEGFFVPKDGKQIDEFQETYLVYSRLENIINTIPCKHILLSLDACYSGTFDEEIAQSRGGMKRPGEDENAQERFILQELAVTSRFYLTSGGKERTPDRSGFAMKFLEALEMYRDRTQVLSFSNLVGILEQASPRPRYGKFGEHENRGNFLFIPERILRQLNFQGVSVSSPTNKRNEPRKAKGDFSDLRAVTREKVLEPNAAFESSSYGGGYQAEKAKDRNTSSCWYSASGKVRGEHISFLFREPKEVTGFEFYYKANLDGRPPRKIKLTFSDGSEQRIELKNPDGWERVSIIPVKTNSIKFRIEEDNPTVNAQYLIICEIKTFGRDLEAVEDYNSYSKVNVREVSTSSNYSGYPGNYAIDGITNTSWYSKSGRILDESIKLSFDRPRRIAKLRLFRPINQDGRMARKARIYYSATDLDASFEIEFRGLEGWEEVLLPDYQYDYFEMVVEEVFSKSSSNYFTLSEIELYEKD